MPSMRRRVGMRNWGNYTVWLFGLAILMPSLAWAQLDVDAGGDLSALSNSAVVLDGSATTLAVDNLEDGTIVELSYRWTQVSGPGGGSLSFADSPRAIFNPVAVGTYGFRLDVDVQNGDSGSDTILLSVSDDAADIGSLNADAGRDRYVALGDRVRLDGSGSSSSAGTAIGYSWSLESAPAGSLASLLNASTANPVLNIDLSGDYSLLLTIMDATGQTDSDRIALSTEGVSPSASIRGAHSGQLGTVVYFDPEGSIDADGDDLAESWTLLSRPSGSLAEIGEDLEGGRKTLTPDAPGDYVLQLELSDETGLKSRATHVFHAVAADGSSPALLANTAPVASLFMERSAEGLVLDASGSSDADGDRLSYRWSVLSGGAGVTLIEDDRPRVAVEGDIVRETIVQVVVTDAHGGRDAATLALSPDAPRLPTVMASGVGTPLEGVIAERKAQAEALAVSRQSGSAFGLSYEWAYLGAAPGEGDLVDDGNAHGPGAAFTFAKADPGARLRDEHTISAVAILGDFNVFTAERQTGGGTTEGRTVVGGALVGQPATFGTGLAASDSDIVLSVAGQISGGLKTVAGSGHVETGSRPKAKFTFPNGGGVESIAGLDHTETAEALRALSEELAALPANSDIVFESTSSGRVATFQAVPDAFGLAVFELADVSDVIDSAGIAELRLEAGDARTILINAGGSKPKSRVRFGDGFTSDSDSARVLWNFHAATLLDMKADFEGSILAPLAFVKIHADVDGSVVSRTLQQHGSIGLPSFSGKGLAGGPPIAATTYALAQVAVTDTAAPELGAAFANVVLTAGNRRPIAAAQTVGPILEYTRGMTVTLDGGASVDDEPLAYNWSFLHAPEGSVAALRNVSSRTADFEADAVGQYVVQLVVSDGRLSSTPVTVVVEVVNTPPMADAGPDIVAFIGEEAEFDGRASSDADGDALTYAWTIVERPGSSLAMLDGADIVVARLVPDAKGDYVVELVVNDGAVDSEPDRAILTVPNRAPVALIDGPTEGVTEAVLAFDARGSSDPDGDALSFMWTLTVPTGSQASLSDPAAAEISFVPDIPGDYGISLTASDGEVLSAPVTQSVTVIPNNRPPELSPLEPRQVTLGATLSVSLEATDPDGDVLSYGVAPLPLPQGAAFDGSSGVFTFAPRTSTPSTYTFTFSVSDGQLSDTESLDISVLTDGNLQTTYAGQVIDAQTGQPVADAEVFVVGGPATRTDALGRFTLVNVPSGTFTVCVNADTGTTPYAPLTYSVEVIEFADNVAPEPIRLSPAVASATVSDGTDVVLESAADDGVRVVIPSTSLPGGSAGDTIVLSAFRPDAAPQLPLGIEPCSMFVLGPKGLILTGGIEISVENYDNLPAGTEVDVWMFVDDQFRIVGTGSVSGNRVVANVADVVAGAPLAFAPRAHEFVLNDDQPSSTFTRSLLGEGGFRYNISLPTYGSFGQEDTTRFVYNSRAADSSALLSGTATFGSARPETVTSRLSVAGADQTFEDVIAVGSQSSVIQRGYVSGTGLDADVYPVRFLSIARYGCSSVTAAARGRVALEDGSDGPIGPGWAVGEVQTLTINDDGISIREGDGTVRQFDAPVPTVAEDFTDSFGGWGVVGASTGLSYQPTGGNPGGHLQEVDIVTRGNIVYWRAPLEIAERLPDFIGGVFTYDMRQNNITRQFGMEEDLVVETGQGDRLFYNYPNSVFPGTAWTKFEIPLSHDKGWRLRSSSGTKVPTAEEFRDVLERATLFRFRAEHRTGPDIVYLDNVAFGPQTVDIGGRRIATTFESPEGEFSTLRATDEGTFERLYPDGKTIVFNAEGQHIATLDSNGNRTSYIYDDQGRVVEIIDPTGQTTRFVYIGRNLSSVIDPAGRETFFGYDEDGKLIELTKPGDETTRFGYDENARLISLIDPRGLETRHQYGSDGSYEGATRPDGSQVKLSVARSIGLDDLGTLEEPRPDADDGGFTTMTDGRGNVTEYELNRFGAIILSIDPLGRETRYERNEDNLVTTVIMPSDATGTGHVRSEFEYDDKGNLTVRREAVGTDLERTTTYAYEPQFSRLTQEVDPDGFVTTYDYDDRGNLLREEDPEGAEKLYTYDENGLVLSRTDWRGNLTTYTYDTAGRLETMTDPKGVTTRLILTPAGNPAVQVDAEGTPAERRVTMAYDANNRLILQSDGEGGTTTYEFDKNGNLIKETDPTGVLQTRTYDTLNRLTAFLDPARGEFRMEYDADDNLIATIDALGARTEHSYDEVGRRKSSTDAIGGVRGFTYDAADNVTSMRDARGSLTLFAYDALKRLDERANALGQVWRYSYDGRDNRITATRPDGDVITSTFDANSRLTALSGGAANRRVERRYTYDDQGNILTAEMSHGSSSGVSLAFAYDDKNFPERATVSNSFGDGAIDNVFLYTHDELDRRDRLTDSFGGPILYGYDRADRLSQVQTPDGDVISMNHDEAGRIVERLFSNATRTEWSYELETGRIIRQAHLRVDTMDVPEELFSARMTYTARGHLANLAETYGNGGLPSGTAARLRDFVYDPLERLTNVDAIDDDGAGNTFDFGLDEDFDLDAEGNRLVDGIGETVQTDAANRIQSDGRYSYSFDANGNLVERNALPGTTGLSNWQYDYDTLDQLIEVRRDGATVQRTAYDAFGRRAWIETFDSGIPSRMAIISDGPDRVLDLRQNASGAVEIVRRVIHGATVDTPLRLESLADGTMDIFYYHPDYNGSIRLITDSVGDIAKSYQYGAYGDLVMEAGTLDQPFQYTAREWDEDVDLYHYRARAYDPIIGRFIQEDPLGYILPCCTGEGQTLSRMRPGGASFAPFANGSRESDILTYNSNLYGYAKFNPVNFMDPWGESPGWSYSRLIKNAPKFVRNIDFAIRKMVGRLPLNKKGMIYDPRTGRFLAQNSNKNAPVVDKFMKFLQECLDGALSKSGGPISGLAGLFCYVAATLAEAAGGL